MFNLLRVGNPALVRVSVLGTVVRRMSASSNTGLYPPIEPYESGMLKVSDLHTVYWEQSGNKTGKPVVFLHGGPGGGTSGYDRRYFDPSVYRIVLMDQRGAGKSTPSASLVVSPIFFLLLLFCFSFSDHCLPLIGQHHLASRR